MPRISEFYGIAIYMYHRDHAPPHFHAMYGQFEAVISIDTMKVLEGKLPPRAIRLVLEWASQYRSELTQDWELARAHQSLNRIPPLD